MSAQPWEDRILDTVLREARDTYGRGWSLLGNEMRANIIAGRVLAAISGLDTEGYTDEQKANLLGKVLSLAGRATALHDE